MPQSEHITKKVPRRALRFAAEFAPTDETAPQRDDSGTMTIPFTMTARTGGVAVHPWWGRCVHDFAGMVPAKPTVTVDYCHDPGEVVGFSNDNQVADNALRMAGSLVSLEPNDRAEEIYRKGKAGVPYEASILTNWDGLIIEQISEGMVATVNDQEVEGPLTIFRVWELWGVAVCPYGSDANTDVQFAAGSPGEVEISFIEGSAMTTPTPAATVETPAAKTGKDYMGKFGESKGSLWFAQGKPWDECVTQFEADMATDAEKKDTEIAELKAAMAALQAKYDALAKEDETVKAENAAFKRGTEPVSGNTPPADKPVTQQFGGLSEHGCRFASSIKVPSKN